MSSIDFLNPYGAVPLALLSDTARMFRQLGVESVRASVVHLGSRVLQPAWGISDLGEIEDDGPPRPLDSAFPGAVAMVLQIAQSTSGETATQKLSPRLWILAWRLDNLHAVVAEARYRDAHAETGDVELTLMRLVCNNGIRAKLNDTPSQAEDSELTVWPMVDRRQRAARTPKRLAALLMCIACAVAALWLAVVALPAAQDTQAAHIAEVTRLRTMSDTAMLRSLSTAMATGDYGEVQAALASLESLGYVRRALVTNERQQNVAMVGSNEGLSIGIPVPPDVVRAAQAMDLQMGAQRYGQLLLLQPMAAGPASARLDAARMAAMLIVVVSTATAALLVRRRRAPAASS